eukprot:SAG31_NODE_14006_length_832_cov_1.560709_1_plen_96_part_10
MGRMAAAAAPQLSPPPPVDDYDALYAADAQASAALASAARASADARAALLAHPGHAFRFSPLRILDARSSLQMIISLVPEGDALALALSCKQMRDW